MLAIIHRKTLIQGPRPTLIVLMPPEDSVTISTTESVSQSTTSGSAETGATIETGSVAIELPAADLTGGAKALVLPFDATASIPIVRIDDSDMATIETLIVDNLCAALSLRVPATQGASEVHGAYTITRVSNDPPRGSVDGLSNTALATLTRPDADADGVEDDLDNCVNVAYPAQLDADADGSGDAYDPDGGFVTGGGWIDSPAGANASDPDMTGKATFGFVAKYEQGQSTPSGNTEFHFKAGDLRFKSNADYMWLVVSGSGHKATYKGTGTVNGQGNYGFMVSAIDAANTSSTDDDLFRIKIWDKDAGDAVIYDNHCGSSGEDADPCTALGGGNIKIHKP